MDQRAFGLRPEYQDQVLAGATVAFGPATELLDIKKALDAGGGTIVSSDPSVIQVLGGFPALQPVDVPPGAADTDVGVTGYIVPSTVAAAGVVLQGSMPNPDPTKTASVPTADLSDAGISPPEPVFEESDNPDAGAGEAPVVDPPPGDVVVSATDFTDTIETTTETTDDTEPPARGSRR